MSTTYILFRVLLFLCSQHFIKFVHIYILLIIYSSISHLPLGFEDDLLEGLPLLSQIQKEITDVIVFKVLWEQIFRQCTQQYNSDTKIHEHFYLLHFNPQLSQDSGKQYYLTVSLVGLCQLPLFSDPALGGAAAPLALFPYRPDLVIIFLPFISYPHAPRVCIASNVVMFHIFSWRFCTFVIRGFDTL